MRRKGHPGMRGEVMEGTSSSVRQMRFTNLGPNATILGFAFRVPGFGFGFGFRGWNREGEGRDVRKVVEVVR